MSEDWSVMQTLNFHILTALHEACRDDVALACCKRSSCVLAAEGRANAAAVLQPLEIIQVAENMGDKALFAVADMHAVLTAPKAVLPILATAYARRPPASSVGAPPEPAA